MLTRIMSDYQNILFDTAIIFSSVFEIILAYILVNNFFVSRFKHHGFDFLPFVGVAAVVIFLQRNGMSENLRYLTECAVLLLFLFLLFKGDLRSKLIAAVTFVLLILMSKTSAAFILLIIKRRAEIEAESPYLRLVELAAANVIMIVISIFISVFARRFARPSVSLRFRLALFSVPVITVMSFSVFQYSLENTPDGDNNVVLYIYLSSAGLIFINILVFFLFSRLQKQLALKRDTDILTSQLFQQEMSVKRMETLYNRTRTFRHDIKNHILLMNMLAEQGNFDELKKYLRDMSGIIDESDYVRISGVSAVDAILNEKMYEAQAKDITTGFDVVNINENTVQPIDLCIILSNALDNAIEANTKIEDTSLRYIKLKAHGENGFTVISVSNPVGEEPERLSSGLFATSKEDTEAHGFGLKSIENTVRRYNGETVAKCENGIFTLVVRLAGTKAD